MATPDTKTTADVIEKTSNVVDGVEADTDDRQRDIPSDPEALAAILAATPGYRVLREVTPRTEFAATDGRPTLRGIIVDVETTGLDRARDEILEVGMLAFTYTQDGDVIATGPSFSGLRQPTCPIPSAVTRLTGITDATVDGLRISADSIDQFIGCGSLLIAHNASFDRPFMEALCPRVARMPWACSLTQVDWQGEGFSGARLCDLAHHHGTFFRSHRAIDDCRALLDILSRPMPASGTTALAALLQAARRPTLKVWARGAPFDMRSVLKSSGYRWNPGEDGRPRAWSKEVTIHELEAELAFLTEFFFDGAIDPLVTEIDAYSRFSSRA